MLRALMTVSGFTLLSRVLGLVRDMVISHHLGVGGKSDAWNSAFQFPNMFRRVFGEGAFNAAFIPLYSDKLEKGEKGAFEYGNKVVVLLALILAGIFGISMLFIGPIMWMFNWGYPPETLDLTISLARITTGYLFFVCLLAAFSGILNSHRKFAAPAMSYAFLNVIFLIAMFCVLPFIGVPEEVLAWSLLSAGVIQLMVVVIPAWKMGFKVKWVKPKIDSDMKKLGILMLPGLVAAGVQQLNLLVGGMVASNQVGAKSLIYTADRINQFPLGLIGIAFGVVLLPEISRNVKANKMEAAKESLQTGMSMAMLLALPAMVGIGVLAEPIIDVMFRSGEFTSSDSVLASQALLAFSLGCPAYIMARVVQPGYFAREDTKTPMRFTFISAFANIILCLIAYAFLNGTNNLHIGCAVATTIAGWLNVLMLIVGLNRRGYLSLTKEFWVKLFKMLIASVVMGVVVWFAAHFLHDALHEGHKAIKFLVLGAIAATGIVCYFLVSHIIGAATLREIKAGFRPSA